MSEKKKPKGIFVIDKKTKALLERRIEKVVPEYYRCGIEIKRDKKPKRKKVI